MENPASHSSLVECQQTNGLDYDICKADLPSELLSLTQREQRHRLAEMHGVTTDHITLHKKGKYSAFVNAKSAPTSEDSELFVRLWIEKQEAERRFLAEEEEKQRRRNEKRAKELAKVDRRQKGKSTAYQDEDAVVDISKLRRRVDRGDVRNYSPDPSKCSDPLKPSDYLALYAACNSAKDRRLLIAAANEAQYLLMKSPKGYWGAADLRKNRHFRAVKKMPNGNTLLRGILTCVDRSYEVGVRPQRYELGPFVPHLLYLQKQGKIKNHTYHQSLEAFNRCVNLWAEKRGLMVEMRGGFAYVSIGNRLYNPLTNATGEQIIERLKAMGLYSGAPCTKVDLEAALPSLMNREALERCLHPFVFRPTVQHLKEARLRIASEFNIPLELAKTLHTASHNGSLIGIESSCWDGYDHVDHDTRLKIAASKDLHQNRTHFNENFKIFEEAGLFDFIENRESLTKSKQYARLYNILESQTMKKLHDYLEYQNILFVCKHDGVDVFSPLSARQEERIKEILGVPCSISRVQRVDEVRRICSSAAAAILIKAASAPYDVQTLYSHVYSMTSKTVIRSNSPP